MAVAQFLPAVSATVLADRGALSPALKTAAAPASASGGSFTPGPVGIGTCHSGSTVASKPSSSSSSTCARARRVAGDEDLDLSGEVIADDFYSVLGVTPDATPEEIKKAYYSCMKVCHPDLSGNNPETTAFCMFINEVYEVLADPEQRLIYDEINGYALTAVNPFLNDEHEKDHAFVDEFTCIGCKNCANTAPDSFDIEMDFGRARVVCQKGSPALVQRAIDTCPVDCIHWVTPAQLTLLEDEMRRVERVNVGMMLSGMGSQTPDVFAQASWRWEKRQSKALEKARRRMMQESGRAWWDGMYNPVSSSEEYHRAEGEEARKRAARTAAAARRWREYSRQGVDRRATKILAAARAMDADDEGNEQKESVSV